MFSFDSKSLTYLEIFPPFEVRSLAIGIRGSRHSPSFDMLPAGDDEELIAGWWTTRGQLHDPAR